MATAEIDIEWIVREVVRRLRDLGATTTNGQASPSTAVSSSDLSIEERLVTLDTLYNRMAGVKSVIVTPRAIVTPAVIDELKDRGVSLVRTGTDRNRETMRHAAPAEAQLPLVYVAVDGVDVDALQRMCGTSIVVELANGLSDWLNVISRQTQRGLDAVLVTDTPAAAVVNANRDTSIRAAVGANFPAVRQAVDEANANLLAVDPRGKNTMQLFGLINEFLNRK